MAVKKIIKAKIKATNSRSMTTIVLEFKGDNIEKIKNEVNKQNNDNSVYITPNNTYYDPHTKQFI